MSEFSPILIANTIFHVTVLLRIYFCDQFMAPEIRHIKRHCSVCQQRGQDFDKSSYFIGCIQRGWETNFMKKAGQSVVLISCWRSCGTQAQLTGGQSAADSAVLALKKTLRQFNDLASSQEDKPQADPQDCPWDHGRWAFIGCLCPGLSYL